MPLCTACPFPQWPGCSCTMHNVNFWDLHSCSNCRIHCAFSPFNYESIIKLWCSAQHRIATGGSDAVTGSEWVCIGTCLTPQ